MNDRHSIERSWRLWKRQTSSSSRQLEYVGRLMTAWRRQVNVRTIQSRARIDAGRLAASWRQWRMLTDRRRSNKAKLAASSSSRLRRLLVGWQSACKQLQSLTKQADDRRLAAVKQARADAWTKLRQAVNRQIELKTVGQSIARKTIDRTGKRLLRDWRLQAAERLIWNRIRPRVSAKYVVSRLRAYLEQYAEESRFDLITGRFRRRWRLQLMFGLLKDNLTDRRLRRERRL